MAEELKVNRKQIEISNGRTMNIYTFDLDGEPMAEMKPEDVVPTIRAEQSQKADG